MTTERKAAGPIAASPTPDGGAVSRRRASRRACIHLLLLLFALAGIWVALIPAAIAAAEGALPLQEVTWAHPTPGRVQGFVILISPVAGLDDAARQIDVGRPAGRSMGDGGMWAFSAIVPAALEEFFAVAAVGRDGTRSPLSAWSVVAPTAPGQPLLIQP